MGFAGLGFHVAGLALDKLRADAAFAAGNMHPVRLAHAVAGT